MSNTVNVSKIERVEAYWPRVAGRVEEKMKERCRWSMIWNQKIMTMPKENYYGVSSQKTTNSKICIGTSKSNFVITSSLSQFNPLRVLISWQVIRMWNLSISTSDFGVFFKASSISFWKMALNNFVHYNFKNISKLQQFLINDGIMNNELIN